MWVKLVFMDRSSSRGIHWGFSPFMDSQTTLDLEWCSLASKCDIWGSTITIKTINTSFQTSSHCASNCEECNANSLLILKVQGSRPCFWCSKAEWSRSWSVEQLQSLYLHELMVRFFPIHFLEYSLFAFKVPWKHSWQRCGCSLGLIAKMNASANFEQLSFSRFLYDAKKKTKKKRVDQSYRLLVIANRTACSLRFKSVVILCISCRTWRYCNPLLLPWPKKKNHHRDSRREERCSTCDIMLDQARSAQGKSDPRLSATFALRWSRLIEHDITRGTAFFSPRISRMVLFFGQGSISVAYNFR